jgi:hypothetical protein
VKFIHTAGIYLDSPLSGFAACKDAPADLLKTVTRDAFTRLVEHTTKRCMNSSGDMTI